MIRLEGDRLPDEAKGAVPPVLFGDLHEDVIGIPLQVGYAATLAQNCGIQTPDDDPPTPAANATIEISGPDMETIKKYVPVPGVIQIDSEWMVYSAFLSNPYRLVLTQRGIGATDPAPHSKGAQIVFVEAKPIYVFAWNPPGHAYPAGAVVKVRINDSAQVPFHTIRLQDTRLVLGHRLLTIEFDLTRGIIGVPGSSNIVSIAGGGPTGEEEEMHRAWRTMQKSVDRKRRRMRHTGKLWTVRDLPPIAGGSGVVGFNSVGFSSSGGRSGHSGLGGILPSYMNVSRMGQSSRPGQPLQKQKLLGPQPPDMLRAQKAAEFRPSTARAAGLASGEPRPRPVRLLTLPLGRVTADIRGIADSATARMGEGANEIMTHPAPISKLILEETFGHTNRDEAVWAATHARQVGLGIAWRFKWYGEPFETFRQTAGYCGQADLYFDDEGRAVYRFRERQAPAVASITERELVGELQLGWTDYQDLATRLDVTWGDIAFKGGSFILNSPMISRYDVRRKPLDLAWVTSENAARLVARYWLGQKDRPRMVAMVGVSPSLAALTRTDRVFMKVPLAELYTKTIPFMIRGTTDRGAERVLAVVEADPLAKEILAYGTLSLARAHGVPAYGTLAVTPFVPTLWRAVLPGDGVTW